MKYTIFGESHGPAIGVVLEGVPAGLELDFGFMRRELDRRAGGKNALSTPRKEGDKVKILSGVFQGRTTGTPLCMMIENTNQKSGDYSLIRDMARPGHADYTGFVRSHGCNDYRGGGHFSGRLTAPLVAAGAIAKQVLIEKDIYVGAHISEIHGVKDYPFTVVGPEVFSSLALKDFPVLNDAAGEEMQAEILKARENMDSVGGVITCAVTGLRPGLGGPDFDWNVEGLISRYLFAVPAVKGVAFGDGFGLCRMYGSEANDPFRMEDGKVVTTTNRNGGINGGITNGMPVVFDVAIKPTPSIGKAQDTVNFRTRQDAVIETRGRHDPCIVHRAVPVIESAAALAVCELLGI